MSKHIQPLTNTQCCLLITGYFRSFEQNYAMPSDICRLCTSFFSMWSDLKLIYCDDKTGAINLNQYKIKPIWRDSNLCLKEIAKQIEEKMDLPTLEKARQKLARKSRKELIFQCKEQNISANGSNYEIINSILSNLSKSWGCRNWNIAPDIPFVRIWMQQKYTIDATGNGGLTQNDWIAVPENYLTEIYLCHLQKRGLQCLVIERKQITNFDGSGTWPRENG